MTLEDILANVNYNIEKIVEELRNRIKSLSGITETIDKAQIIYQYSGKDFCVMRIRKDLIEIDFKADKTITDPIEFSWKIRQSKKCRFERRMHMKNIFDIDTAFILISQSYRSVLSPKLDAKNKNVRYV